MKRDILVIAAAFLVFFSCKNMINTIKGTGPMETITRDIRDFNGIELGTSADVFFTQGDEFKVVVEAQQNIAELLQTTVENGMLKIYFKNDIGNVNYDKLIIRVQAPLYERINLLGSGNMIAQNAMKGDKLSLIITGSGDLEIKEAKFNDIKSEVSGSGNLEIGGSSESCIWEITGSGDVKAFDLKSKQVKAEITGSGNIECHAENSLEASVTGSGDIQYDGSPSVQSRITGSGSVEKK